MFGNEETSDLYAAEFAPVRGLTERVYHGEGRLRFTDPRLERAVREVARLNVALGELAPIGLCADARSLAASDFTKLTPNGRRFLKRATPLLLEPVPTPIALARMMRRFAPGVVNAELPRLRTLQGRTTNQASAQVATAIVQLNHALIDAG